MARIKDIKQEQWDMRLTGMPATYSQLNEDGIINIDSTQDNVIDLSRYHRSKKRFIEPGELSEPIPIKFYSRHCYQVCIMTKKKMVEPVMTKLSLVLLPVLMILAFDTTADIYRDKNGIQTGSSTTDSSGHTIYRNKNGIPMGSSATDSSGNIIYRDKNGIQTGKAQTSSSGRTVYRDKNGIQSGSSDTNSSGRTIYRDKNGIQTGSATTDSSGRTIYRDKNGIQTGSKQ